MAPSEELLGGFSKMSDSVLIALIAGGFSSATSIVLAVLQARITNRNAAKQSILQMIMEDHLSHSEDKLPTNYQNVLHEYDIYHKNGGNSYVTEKVDDYKKWFMTIEKEKHENSN